MCFPQTESAKNQDDDHQQQRHQRHQEEEEFLRKLEVIANSVHNCIGRLARFEPKLSKAFASSARSLTRKFVRSMAFNTSSGFSSIIGVYNVLFYFTSTVSVRPEKVLLES